MTIETGKDLFSVVNGGHISAFTQFYNRYFQRLLLTADKYVKDSYIAEEIVQNVFLKIWENADNMEDVRALKPYLYRSVINASINHVNRRRTIEHHHQQMASDFSEAYLIDLDEENELIVALYQEIEKLPAQCRKVFKLNRFERLKYKEIALSLQISERTVENHIAFALKSLRKAMLEKHDVAGPGKRKLFIQIFLT